MVDVTIDAAADTLRVRLFGVNRPSPLGFVGIKPKSLVVCVYGPQDHWTALRPTTWQGWLVEWRFNAPKES